MTNEEYTGKLKRYHCAECGKDFEDGEGVAVSVGGKFYHTFIEMKTEFKNPSCIMQQTLNWDRGVQCQRKVYYQDALHNLEGLKDIEGLKVEFNEAKTGDIIEGNLEELAQSQ